MGPVPLGLSRRCVPKGGQNGMEFRQPTTEARGSMEKREAEPKQIGTFSRQRLNHFIVSEP
jgi:hypothetical protein